MKYELNSKEVHERTTPQLINEVTPGYVFVFGSNTLGRHGRGAAQDALRFGATPGVGEGHVGNTYALPTKGSDFRKSLPLEVVQKYVNKFVDYAVSKPELTFLVTPVGTGLAKYSVQQVAPLFYRALYVRNVHLPSTFWKVLLQKIGNTK